MAGRYEQNFMVPGVDEIGLYGGAPGADTNAIPVGNMANAAQNTDLEKSILVDPSSFTSVPGLAGNAFPLAQMPVTDSYGDVNKGVTAGFGPGSNAAVSSLSPGSFNVQARAADLPNVNSAFVAGSNLVASEYNAANAFESDARDSSMRRGGDQSGQGIENVMSVESQIRLAGSRPQPQAIPVMPGAATRFNFEGLDAYEFNQPGTPSVADALVQQVTSFLPQGKVDANIPELRQAFYTSNPVSLEARPLVQSLMFPAHMPSGEVVYPPSLRISVEGTQNTDSYAPNHANESLDELAQLLSTMGDDASKNKTLGTDYGMGQQNQSLVGGGPETRFDQMSDAFLEGNAYIEGGDHSHFDYGVPSSADATGSKPNVRDSMWSVY